MRILLLFLSILSYPQSLICHHVGLLIVATGKYNSFIEPLITSARTHFCTQHQVTYVIFTEGSVPAGNDIVHIYQERIGWPYDTLLRSAMYINQAPLLSTFDYIFACDADMLFCSTVGEEILSDRVATLHPGYVGRRGTYETRPQSTAYVAQHEGKCYFAGGFFGGSSTEFITMVHHMTENIATDLDNGLIAVWHDESHLNRYCINNPPTRILSPSYCYPGNLVKPYPKIIWALEKNHADYQK